MLELWNAENVQWCNDRMVKESLHAHAEGLGYLETAASNHHVEIGINSCVKEPTKNANW